MVRTRIISPHIGVLMPTNHKRNTQEPAAIFLICAFPYTHRSSGVRALYRLCHHLNQSGYPAAILLKKKPWWYRVIRRIYYTFRTQKRARFCHASTVPNRWNIRFHKGPIRDSIVVYPEVIKGNPYRAKKVIRWVLNNPGLLGGDSTYPDSEMVFIYDIQRLKIVNQAVSIPLTPQRVLWFGLIDPDYIYPDANTPKTINCSFIHKGHHLKKQFSLPDKSIIPLEDMTPNMQALGEVLRRTRVLYSYDHYRQRP